MEKGLRQIEQKRNFDSITGCTSKITSQGKAFSRDVRATNANLEWPIDNKIKTKLT